MSAHFDFSKYLSPIFIETGTHVGTGCKRAINAGFKTLHSIEIHPEIHQMGKKNLDEYINSNNLQVDIHLHLGNSVDMLREILDTIDNQCTFWLDGHGGYYDTSVEKQLRNTGTVNCPLMQELEAIGSHHIKEHIIMIDDLRMINKGAWRTPGINESTIKAAIDKINPGYKYVYEPGCRPNDCLVAMVHQ